MIECECDKRGRSKEDECIYETPCRASSAAQRRIWRGVPAVHATVYRDDDGNEIIGSRGEWMLLAGESVCGPFRTLTEAKQYVEDNDV